VDEADEEVEERRRLTRAGALVSLVRAPWPSSPDRAAPRVVLLQQQIEGKYEILEKIKEGGMGAVYKVRHRFLDEIRVIKVIRSSLEPTQELSERFLREARLANRMRHPSIAALHDFAVGEDGNAFIVMEYIAGLTLEDVLRSYGPPPLGLALEASGTSGALERAYFSARAACSHSLAT
jgi:serine/threonine protein kinase